MKRNPPSAFTTFKARLYRALRKMVRRLHEGPGEHSCWSCKLYDSELHACTILVDRGKHAPKDPSGRRVTELRRVWPFDLCVRLPDMEMGRIVIFDKDSPEHSAGKAQLAEIEAEARAKRMDDMDYKLLEIVKAGRNKKKSDEPVSNGEYSHRGDPWVSTNAKDAVGPRRTNPR